MNSLESGFPSVPHLMGLSLNSRAMGFLKHVSSVLVDLVRATRNAINFTKGLLLLPPLTSSFGFLLLSPRKASEKLWVS